MRNGIITLFVFMVTLSGAASVNASAYDYGKRVTSLMKEFSMNRDFKVNSLKKFSLTIIKGALSLSNDSEVLGLLNLVKDVKSVSIARFEECDSGVKSRFASRLSKILVDDYLMAEIKDSGETVKIYAIPLGEGVIFSDLIIIAPASWAVTVSGRINAQDVANYLQSMS